MNRLLRQSEAWAMAGIMTVVTLAVGYTLLKALAHYTPRPVGGYIRALDAYAGLNPI